MVPNYGDPLFWKEVYSGRSKWQEAIPAEWLLSYSHFKAQRWHRYLRGGSILELGCGNSEFMSDAYDDEFKLSDITCVDIDPGVVKKMRLSNAIPRPGIKYRECDACDMRCFADRSFDIVLEKSTMDTLPWEFKRRCSSEVHRVLKDSGMFVSIGLAHPAEFELAVRKGESRRRLWWIRSCTCESAFEDSSGEKQQVYMYVCQKLRL